MTMSLTKLKYIDGYYGTPQRISRTPRRYPFAGNGDITTAEYDATYLVDQAAFTPTARGTVDPENAGFYLIAEGKPEIYQGDLATFVRTYSSVPLQQIEPGSRFITKPDLPGTFPQVSGNSLIVKPEANVPRWVFYTQKSVTSDSGVPASISYPTGGTFAITIGADTTSAIPFNASAATVAAALNTLPSVSDRGSVTVTGAYNSPGGFQIIFATYAVGSIDGSGLTVTTTVAPGASAVLTNTGTRMSFYLTGWPASGDLITGGTFTVTIFGQTTAPIAYNASGATCLAAIQALSKVGSGATIELGFGLTTVLNDANKQILFHITIPFPTHSVSSSLTPLGSTATAGPSPNAWLIKFSGVLTQVRTLFSASHGITAADSIIVTQGGTFRTLPAGTFTTTTDTIVLTAASGVAYTTAALITKVGKATGNSYTAGTKLTRVKRVSDFYLPGVTVGIATIDDIPLPTYEGDDASLLAAIFDGDTDINYEVGELEYYQDGPIVMRTRTTLNAATL